MKTSNKILLALAVLLFTIPLSLMVSFSNKIKNKDFVLKQSEWLRHRNFVNAPVIRVSSDSRNWLECTIHHSDSAYYTGQFSGEDSIAVSSSQDTLSFRLLANGDHADPVSLDIFLPFNGRLVADGAAVTIDKGAIPALSEFTLLNNASLVFGKEGDSIPNHFQAIKVRSYNSNININANSHISRLMLSLEGKSALRISRGAAIDSLSGTVSDESILDGPASYLHQLIR
jgi:hypothetical protein